MKTFLKNKKALITGATGGIGEATAKQLAKHGAFVILTGRNTEKLKKIEEEIREAGGEACSVQADLTVESERLSLYQAIYSRFGLIDILVNSAGFGWYGYGDGMNWKIADEMIKLNTSAVVHLTLLYLKDMKARDSGHIINISSIAADLPSQGIALYSGTKAFLDNFSTCLYRELRGSKVQISLIKPGPVKTGFFTYSRNRFNGLSIPAEGMGITPVKVAEKIIEVIHRPRKKVYIPRFYSLVFLLELFFSWVFDLLGPMLLRKKLIPTKENA